MKQIELVVKLEVDDDDDIKDVIDDIHTTLDEFGLYALKSVTEKV